MKLKNIFLTLFGAVLIFLSASVYAAQPVTYERTEMDLKVRDSIKVNSSNKYSILKTPRVDADKKIYDFADLLTDSEEERLYGEVKSFIETYNMDMVIVTIDDNNKSTSQDWADDFYDYNDFGVGNTYDGLLFLIDMDKRNMWISTTGHAILVYSDIRIDNILDDTYEQISKKDYYMCSTVFIKDAKKYAKQGVASSNKNYKIDSNGEYVKVEPFPIFPIMVVSSIATLIFFLIARARHRTIAKATKASQYLVKNSLDLSVRDDKFINTHTSKTYSPQSSGGGSSGGGSSTHHSSSGGCHGGGGRSF